MVVVETLGGGEMEISQEREKSQGNRASGFLEHVMGHGLVVHVICS
jgi:hypothetical protein